MCVLCAIADKLSGRESGLIEPRIPPEMQFLSEMSASCPIKAPSDARDLIGSARQRRSPSISTVFSSPGYRTPVAAPLRPPCCGILRANDSQILLITGVLTRTRLRAQTHACTLYARVIVCVSLDTHARVCALDSKLSSRSPWSL